MPATPGAAETRATPPPRAEYAVSDYGQPYLQRPQGSRIADLGFWESVGRSLAARGEQRREERARRAEERGKNAREVGISLLESAMQDIPAIPQDELGETSEADARRRMARAEFDFLRNAMFGEPPKDEKLTKEEHRRRAANQDRQVVRLIREWQRSVLEMQERRAYGRDVFSRGVQEGDWQIYLDPGGIEQLRQRLSAGLNGANEGLARFAQTLAETKAGLRVPESSREGLGRLAEGLKNVTLTAGLEAIINGGANIDVFGGPIVEALARAMDSTPQNVVLARAAIDRLTKVAGPLESLIGFDLVGAIEKRFNVPGMINTFMAATQGIADEYYLKNPDARLGTLENMARGWKTQRHVDRLARLRARHEWFLVMGKRGPELEHRILRSISSILPWTKASRAKEAARAEEARLNAAELSTGEYSRGETFATAGQASELSREVYQTRQASGLDARLAAINAGLDAALNPQLPQQTADQIRQAEAQAIHNARVREAMTGLAVRLMQVPDAQRNQVRTTMINQLDADAGEVDIFNDVFDQLAAAATPAPTTP